MRFWPPWRRPEARRPPERADAAASARDLARAARILAVRSRRETTGLFAGSYASAFRGGGIEFEESRPYVPGDDVRSLDWNAFARTGDLFVKRFREERGETVLLALDASASMHFGTTGRSKAATAAHAAALVAAAAGQAGDRVGFLSFDEQVRSQIEPSRGASHTWRVIHAIATTPRSSEGSTRIEAGLEGLLAQPRSRAVAILFSDFRTPGPLDPKAGLAGLARQHDLVSVILHDPAEERLPRAGLVRLRDPEGSRSLLLDTNSATTRARYRRAWAARAARLERTLRSSGSDVLWLHTNRDALQTLMRFFHQRAAHPRPRMTSLQENA